ncbi:MAG: hypothetical protein J5985_08000 [Kiritimatiellae bacterium]|nr:hypothetical protein [Kiritimatiellia bacterium]
MSYESVDKLQNLLANEVFSYTSDKKKAAGRALGTFLEIITYYLIKVWKLDHFAAIEKPLPEFANTEITHNVEFTLHGSRRIAEKEISENEFPISSRSILRTLGLGKEIKGGKPSMLVDKMNVIRNACTLISSPETFVNAYVDSLNNRYFVQRLFSRPFAMFECKRVGVEEGSKKGPQTIEKAKQGSYVARTVSALQRIRRADGSLAGFLQQSETDFIISDYYSLLSRIIHSTDKALLRNFILTVGVVSNHGNWFTSSNPNKELKILAQSYDWLIFLTDKGISEFITELLLSPSEEYAAVKEAFKKSYSRDKKENVFTKVRMTYECDKALCSYFVKKRKTIEGWFNVISPKDQTLDELKTELSILAAKEWEDVYGTL